MLRTHTCGELTAKDIGKSVQLCGWVQSRRDHGGVIFIDLRDRYGLTQVVFDPRHNAEVHTTAEHLGREWVLRISGKVRARPAEMKNEKLPTGAVEIITDHLDVLNQSVVPPIEIEDRKEAGEDVRLKYRYLDLRRPRMQQNLYFRHVVSQAAREYLSSQGFIEIETPMLVKSTPEGARDYVVPSRRHPGKFYALPQSPQLYKQICMVAGLDRYFQIARCLRDEDNRVDRQPEFTQIDIEMSFCTQEDIFGAGEGLMQNIFQKALSFKLPIPFQRIKYDDAMARYGSDKPDIRFGLELCNVTGIVAHSDFSVFKQVIDKKGIVVCLNAKNCASFSRTEIEELETLAKSHHALGLAWMKVKDGKLDSSIVKYFSPKIQEELMQRMDAVEGDLLLFVADKPKIALGSLGQVRLALGEKLKLIPHEKFAFCWIVDFPLFEWNEEEHKWDAAHHPFTMPKEEHLSLIDTNPEAVRAQCYDLVLNGVEICSGSIRINRSDIQEKVLAAVGLSPSDLKEKFGFLIEAFQYGAPPHGGFAPGLDRLCAMMLGTKDIREVIAFPKNKQAQGLMENSPSPLSAQQLKELHLKTELIHPGEKK
ncbi:MAG: aspartate--tRNA ligase [Candidatus Aenigmarchaeota archaeon]|nr:aspartate--tRNA ligase [Candidatus Aenigmarchaeota archaeon]